MLGSHLFREAKRSIAAMCLVFAVNGSMALAQTPTATVTGFSTIGGANNLPQDRRDNTYQFVDNLIWVRSSHSMKFGVDVRRFQSNLYFISQGRGIFNFNTPANSTTVPTSGYPFADLLLGIPTSTQRNPRGPSTYSRTSSFNVYAQDDWKVNSRLTLNLGLRWELNTPMTEKYNTYCFVRPEDRPDTRRRAEWRAG